MFYECSWTVSRSTLSCIVKTDAQWEWQQFEEKRHPYHLFLAVSPEYLLNWGLRLFAMCSLVPCHGAHASTFLVVLTHRKYEVQGHKSKKKRPSCCLWEPNPRSPHYTFCALLWAMMVAFAMSVFLLVHVHEQDVILGVWANVTRDHGDKY